MSVMRRSAPAGLRAPSPAGTGSPQEGTPARPPGPPESSEPPASGRAERTPARDGRAGKKRSGSRPRLGRAAIALPAGSAVSGAILVLPAGVPVSRRRRSPLAHAAALPLARSLARAGAAEGLAVHVVRYRGNGWNGADAQLAADAEQAVEEAGRRYGDVPVCLVGYGMGGRAALHAAGHDAVNSVLALSPWLPEDDVAVRPEPVTQLMGRHVLIMHGTNDARTDPELSYRLAERAKKINRNTCRFEVHSDGHALHQHHHEVLALASDFVLGALLSRAYSRPVADALAAPPPLGLRMPLAAGFGRSLRR